MKFFFSQVEMSKEAVRVGTLALIRAVVSADGELAGGDRGHGQSVGGEVVALLSETLARRPVLVVIVGWAKTLDCFLLFNLELNQHCGPSIPLPSELDFRSQPESESCY